MSGDNTAGWWDTSIIRVDRNEMLIKGYAIEDLMGRVSYDEMAYLMIMGELPPHPQIAHLLCALLVAVCDLGVLSPAVATATMAATCGIPLNCIMASGMNLLGKIHGGPIEDATRLFYRTDAVLRETGREEEDVIREICEEYRGAGEYVPGFGHPVHDRDPRVVRLFELVGEAEREGIVSGRFRRIACLFERILPAVFAKDAIPMNIDAGGAVVLCEAGIPAEAATGFICLSRGLGLMAHGVEELMRKERLKAPMPPEMIGRHMTYSGPPPRRLPEGKFGRDAKDENSSG